VNRDKGLYDNLPYKWKQTGTNARKELFDILGGGDASRWDSSMRVPLSEYRNLNAEQVLSSVMEDVLGVKILSLVIEVADIISQDSYKVGR
jgi:hypothetical protein